MPAAAGEQVVVCVLPFYDPCDVNTRVQKTFDGARIAHSRVCVAGTPTVSCGVWEMFSSSPGLVLLVLESLSLSCSRRPLCAIMKHLEHLGQNLDQILPLCRSNEENDVRDLCVCLAEHHIGTTRR